VEIELKEISEDWILFMTGVYDAESFPEFHGSQSGDK
jgi:hypothetical protein